jgi:hypothetical protein
VAVEDKVTRMKKGGNSLRENLEKSNQYFVTVENIIQDTVTTYWTCEWVLSDSEA